jgi:hypothetical protein
MTLLSLPRGRLRCKASTMYSLIPSHSTNQLIALDGPFFCSENGDNAALQETRRNLFEFSRVTS